MNLLIEYICLCWDCVDWRKESFRVESINREHLDEHVLDAPDVAGDLELRAVLVDRDLAERDLWLRDAVDERVHLDRVGQLAAAHLRLEDLERSIKDDAARDRQGVRVERRDESAARGGEREIQTARAAGGGQES